MLISDLHTHCPHLIISSPCGGQGWVTVHSQQAGQTLCVRMHVHVPACAVSYLQFCSSELILSLPCLCHQHTDLMNTVIEIPPTFKNKEDMTKATQNCITLSKSD